MKLPANVTSLDGLIAFLESGALRLLKRREFNDSIVDFMGRDGISPGDRDAARWEMECFLYHVKGKMVFAYTYSSGNEPLEFFGYPSVEDFRGKAFDYIRERARATKSPYLKARYNHLLWLGPKGVKNKIYVQGAIEGYLELISSLLLHYAADNDIENHFLVVEFMEQMCRLSAEVKLLVPEVKRTALDLLFGPDSVPFFVRHAVLKEMLENNTVFKQADFRGCLTVVEKEMEKGISDRYLWTHDYLPTAIKIAKRAGEDEKIWHERLGDYFVGIAEADTGPQRLWLAYDAFSSALQCFKKAKAELKRKAVEQRMFELKPKITLPKITIKMAEEEIKRVKLGQEFIKKSAEALLCEPPELIYEYLVQGWYYPSKAAIQKSTGGKKYFHEEYLTVVEYDRNKNIRKQGDNAHTSRKFNDIYRVSIERITSSYLYHVFVPGIRSGHLTFRNLLEFLHSQSWLGRPYFKQTMGGEQIELNWITLIAPAIIEYFVQVQGWQWGNGYQPSFVLCIDSLTLKLEGILRNFAQRMNISTVVAGKNGTQEAYVNNVLDDERMVGILGEDDIQFLKYILANEGGANIRNNVAHCFYHFPDYNLEKMHLLLAALLKIARFVEDSSGHSSTAAKP